MTTTRTERTVNYVVLILFALQALIPVLYVVFLALSSETIGDASWGHLENFATAWEQGHFSQYMTNSVLVAVLVGEADNGIVPPVSTCHDGACRPQVDSQIDVCC